jgi:ankyrin repeat protein
VAFFLGPLALHEACIAGALLSVVECIVQAHPKTLHAANNIGQLPLHLARINHVTVGALQFLIQRNKAAVDAHDQRGKTPLVHACETSALLDLVCLLFSMNPTGALDLFSHLPAGGSSDQSERKRQRRA